MLRIFFLFIVSGLLFRPGVAQPLFPEALPHTAIKSQGSTGTCWSFSTISLVESQYMKSSRSELDLSEMFIVRNTYINKAKNYVLRQGSSQFGPGGLGHDVIYAISQFGAIPESIYSGLNLGKVNHDHSEMDSRLKAYLDKVLASRPISSDWLVGFEAILDDHLGQVPKKFLFNEREYDPISFAREVLRFDASDYLFITSFTHHPYYKRFALEVPDNYGSERYWNVPLEDLLTLSKSAVQNGYTVMWDADVSNENFRQAAGYALMPVDKNSFSPDAKEESFDALTRQKRFEELTTQDDHLMHIVGVEKTPAGKNFFIVKNSWGNVGPFKGYIKVSEPYYAVNTISLVIHKAAVSQALLSKLQLD